MTYNVVLNQSNVINTDNNKLKYDFPNTIFFKDDKIALAEIDLAVSWDNVSSVYNNDIFFYFWYDALGVVGPFAVTIPNGYYNVETFNAYFQATMIVNGHYLVDGSGNIVYYMEFVFNRPQQRVEFRSVPIPTALPGGWSNPAGLTFPAVATTPVILIPATPIQDLSGFVAGFYPPVVQSTNYNVIATNYADITPIRNLVILCSLVKNDLQYPNSVLYTFVPGVQAAFPTSGRPTEYAFIDIQNGYYSSFTIDLVNEDFVPIRIKDPQIFISLLIKKRDNLGFLK